MGVFGPTELPDPSEGWKFETKTENIDLLECRCCGFTFAAMHGESCASCEVDELRREIERLKQLLERDEYEIASPHLKEIERLHTEIERLQAKNVDLQNIVDAVDRRHREVRDAIAEERDDLLTNIERLLAERDEVKKLTIDLWADFKDQITTFDREQILSDFPWLEDD